MTDDEALAAVTAALEAGDADELDRITALLDEEDELRRARLERPEALADAARWYARQGIPIFPLRVREKKPIIPAVHVKDDPLRTSCKRACGVDGHGLHDATTDPERVEAWWTRWPQANIGMRTGIIADVIDVDGPQGVINITPYLESIRSRATGIVSTPRPGGLHFYVPPGGRKNSASNLIEHVDTRADGGYVVLPPSVTDEHGPNRRYTWLRPLTVA